MDVLIDAAKLLPLTSASRWIADRLLHRRAADTFGKLTEWAKWTLVVKGGEAANWRGCCEKISRRLQRSGRPLAEGLEWPAAWVRLIRAYQVEMKRLNLIRAPPGASPAEAAPQCPSVSRPDPKTVALAELCRNPSPKLRDKMAYLRSIIGA